MSLSLITRKFTVEEYEKMATEGIIKPDEKVELIRGEIIKMSPMGTRHASSVDRLIQLTRFKFTNTSIGFLCCCLSLSSRYLFNY